MAICGSRSEAIQNPVGLAAMSARTGLIALINNGTASMESHRNVGAGNSSSAKLGKALDAAGDQTAERTNVLAINDRAIASV